VNLLDLLIVVAAVSAGVGGYRLGLLARAASWIGLAIGLTLAARVLPTLIEQFQNNDSASRLLVAAGVLMGGAFVGQGIGLLVGSHVLRYIPHGPFRQFDKVMGAFVGVLGVMVAIWLLLPAMADVPGWASQQARRSQLARAIDDVAPRPPDTLQALRRLVGENDFPRVFDALRPAPVAGPPPEAIPMPLAVQQAVAASTVKVEGEACNRIQEGSGFAADVDTVVTNAHVVAGVRRPRVLRPTSPRALPATIVVFDSDRDLAVLRVPGLTERPLVVAQGRTGQVGAVFGHPGGQDPLRIAPARVTQRVQAVGRDLYDAHQTRRDVFILASELRAGDSGGALVNQAGAVIGVAFAIAPDRPGTAYALASSELRAVLVAPRATQADSGRCLAEA
jgi:S1-C subfamily serine protease